MEERIVIADKDVSVVCKGCIKEDYCNKKYAYEQARCCFTCGLIPANIEVEKYPTSWEELKELCKDLESKNVFIINAGHCIEFNGLYFWKDGSITTTQNNNDIWATKTNLTPARQWQIIKSLIGEE